MQQDSHQQSERIAVSHQQSAVSKNGNQQSAVGCQKDSRQQSVVSRQKDSHQPSAISGQRRDSLADNREPRAESHSCREPTADCYNGTANLRVSYLGGGYDFPEFFATQRAAILSEGIDVKVSCSAKGRAPGFLQWEFPERLGRGLGSSAATALSMIRAKYPHASHQEQIDAAIHLERLQAGGWQDAIASGHTGIFLIQLFQDSWEVEHFDKKCLAQLKKYRKLYEIPNESLRSATAILKEMQHREVGMKRMQALVQQGAMALERLDFVDFGKAVRAGWEIKKAWHPDIKTPVIGEMEQLANRTGAWGWKTCGAGGPRIFLSYRQREMPRDYGDNLSSL